MAVSELQKNEVKRLLSEGRKIEAIKYLKSSFDLDLKQSKELADHIEDEMEPGEFKRPSMTSSIPKVRSKVGGRVGLVFFIIGLGFLAIGIINFVQDSKQIDESVLVIGRVQSNPSQPTIEYEFEGQVYYYYSSVSSDPPSYYVGEEVEVFVNPSYPENAIINTVTDRWFLIIFMGGMGAFFSFFGFIAMKLFK